MFTALRVGRIDGQVWRRWAEAGAPVAGRTLGEQVVERAAGVGQDRLRLGELRGVPGLHDLDAGRPLPWGARPAQGFA